MLSKRTGKKQRFMYIAILTAFFWCWWSGIFAKTPKRKKEKEEKREEKGEKGKERGKGEII